MKKKRLFIIGIMCLFTSAVLSACSPEYKQVPDPKKPVVVTFWHSYNNFAKSVLDEMILEFNDTEGVEKGIIVDAYGYGEQKKLEDALYNSANKLMGAEEMPDMFISYSDNARRINTLAPLVDLNQYFSPKELEEYRHEFLEEGIWGEDSSLKMLPIAKSTELVFINKTAWNKFAADTGRAEGEAGMESAFSSWEEILKASRAYYQWSGGKPMLGFNLNNDLMHVTAAQLGDVPYEIKDGKASVTYSRETAKKIWNICYVPHINGWFESAFYNQDAIKSGRLIAYIGSSAGSGFFPSEVTIDAQNSYSIECSVVSYPSFSSTSNYMTQRGANISIVKTDSIHEYAASEFLKWFTAEKQNIKFAASTGYIPVKNNALERKDEIHASAGSAENKEALSKSVSAALKAVETRKFVTKSPFEHSYEVNTVFSNSIFEKIAIDLNEKNRRISLGEQAPDVISELCGEANFNSWYDDLLINIDACIK